jgi:hypothetical protein
MNTNNFDFSPRIDSEQHNRVLMGTKGEITVTNLPSPEQEDAIAERICAVIDPQFGSFIKRHFDDATLQGAVLSPQTFDEAVTAFIEQQKQGDFLNNSACPIQPVTVNSGDAPSIEYFPGADIQEVGSVLMQEIVGDYDTLDEIPEWDWIEGKASFHHANNGEYGVWEFVMNLSNDFGEIPLRLRPVFNQAKALNLAYLIFHEGT